MERAWKTLEFQTNTGARSKPTGWQLMECVMSVDDRIMIESLTEMLTSETCRHIAHKTSRH